MDEFTLFTRLGLALLMGLLVGFQRQRESSSSVGFRSFTIITMLGATTAALSQSLGVWIVSAGLLAVAGLAVVILARAEDQNDPESIPHAAGALAMVLMYAVGALLVEGPPAVAVAIGGGTAILLHLKQKLHGFADQLKNDEVRAVMQLALVSAVILPVLPDNEYGPYDVLNPRHIWLMVTLIVTISLAAYTAYRLVGQRAGALVGGLLGGAISSTATTVSAARSARASPTTAWWAVVIIMLATAVMYARSVIEVGVVAPTSLLPTAALPLGIMLLVTMGCAGFAWSIAGRDGIEAPSYSNPGELRTALVFGAIYAATLFAVAAARDLLGEAALWPVAALSGMTDMNAITLSISRLVSEGREEASLGWRLIVLASLSNMAFKLAMISVLGGRHLFARIAPLVATIWIAGGLLILLWP